MTKFFNYDKVRSYIEACSSQASTYVTTWAFYNITDVFFNPEKFQGVHDSPLIDSKIGEMVRKIFQYFFEILKNIFLLVQKCSNRVKRIFHSG